MWSVLMVISPGTRRSRTARRESFWMSRSFATSAGSQQFHCERDSANVRMVRCELRVDDALQLVLIRLIDAWASFAV